MNTMNTKPTHQQNIDTLDRLSKDFKPNDVKFFINLTKQVSFEQAVASAARIVEGLEQYCITGILPRGMTLIGKY